MTRKSLGLILAVTLFSIILIEASAFNINKVAKSLLKGKDIEKQAKRFFKNSFEELFNKPSAVDQSEQRFPMLHELKTAA
jgi:hypothetical protein